MIDNLKNQIVKITKEFYPEIKVEDRYVSNCCGAYPLSNGDCDTMDCGICPDCGEHCDYIKESESENE